MERFVPPLFNKKPAWSAAISDVPGRFHYEELPILTAYVCRYCFPQSFPFSKKDIATEAFLLT